jgi:hypothetical protein
MIKTMLIIFFDVKGTIRLEFIPQSQTVNKDSYVEILKQIREAVRITGPKLRPNDWILHHDNFPTHKALSVSGSEIDYRNETSTLFPRFTS